ncbi:hypothetical protein O3M35_010712 [Rhynocoris fuscipes]|uniref:Mitochondrial inner membrane protein Mpv17 n=1 Tax=Rhynocoris fuscipes TaxID=488301 RepID=A0AAW1D1E4_9HEMI
MSILRRISCTYNYWLEVYPYRMQAVQVAGILGLGDVVAQKLIIKQKFDAQRTLRFMSTGLFLGPSIHAWFLVLEKLYGRSKKVAIYKMVTDQLIFAPTMLATMFTYIKLVNGANKQQLKKSLKEEYPKLLLDNYKIWPAAQFLNFYLIPVQFRVVFLQSLAVFWNAYISWKLQMAQDACNPKVKKY